MARPREFEPDEALKKATATFWSKGYHDTSMRDLIDSTGVNQYGLYTAFGGKRELFLKALRLYHDTVTADILSALNAADDPVDGIRRLFERLPEALRNPDGARGCMMCNTAIELAPFDPEVADIVRANRALLVKGFSRRLEQARAQSVIAGDTDLDALAAFLATTAYSAGMLLRLGCSDEHIARYLETALSIVR